MKRILLLVTAAGIAALCLYPSTATAIVYVDADDAVNTARADGLPDPFFNEGQPNSTAAIDGFWHKRALGNPGETGPIYESNGTVTTNPVGEDAPRLVTTISGLEAGLEYNIYAYFHSNFANPGTDWRLRAGLENTVEDLPLFSEMGEDGATAATLVTEENAPEGVTWSFANGNRGLFQAFLGATTADQDGTIPVYIDDFAFPQAISPLLPHFYRTFYDGVGYELVSAPTAIPGDYNNDGMVDAGDYVLWRDSLGSTFNLAGNGDETGDSTGIVDLADYQWWRANFGNPSEGVGTGVTAIPEPGMLSLVAAALLGLAWIRCR